MGIPFSAHPSLGAVIKCIRSKAGNVSHQYAFEIIERALLHKENLPPFPDKTCHIPLKKTATGLARDTPSIGIMDMPAGGLGRHTGGLAPCAPPPWGIKKTPWAEGRDRIWGMFPPPESPPILPPP